MGRPKNDCWFHVEKVEKSKEWKCNYCKRIFKGGASRIQAHLGLNGKEGDIKQCSKYPGNQLQGVYNNLASTSSNPPQAQAAINTIDVTHDQSKSTSLFLLIFFFLNNFMIRNIQFMN
jgi:hypothetical protein